MYPPYRTPAFLSENLSRLSVTRDRQLFSHRRILGIVKLLPEGWPDARFVNLTMPIRKVGNVGANVVARSAIAVETWRAWRILPRSNGI